MDRVISYTNRAYIFFVEEIENEKDHEEEDENGGRDSTGAKRLGCQNIDAKPF